MATKMLRVCDVCERPTDRDLIRFGWGTAFYETDLCDEHSEALTSLIEKAIRTARRVGSEAKAPAVVPVTRRKQRVDTAEVRAWAKSQGIEVSDKGRVPESLILQFSEATRSS
jgi:hypothetical protein